MLNYQKKCVPNETIKSIGLGATSLCNLNCRHCYSRHLVRHSMSLNNAKEILKKFPNVRKINFGTGESFLNKDFVKIARFFYSQGIKLGLTSNGTTIKFLSQDDLRMFSDIDISIDFPNRILHDDWRRSKGLYETALGALKRSLESEINTSIAVALMNINYKYLPEFRKLVAKYKCYLRINIYKPVGGKEFCLSYSEFWEAVRLMAKNFKLVSCSEPILSVVGAVSKRGGSPCRHSVRIHPDLTISECVYLDPTPEVSDVFKKAAINFPKECAECKFVNFCRGGCVSRRVLNKSAYKPDEFCPIIRGLKVPDINFKLATNPKDLIQFTHPTFAQ